MSINHTKLTSDLKKIRFECALVCSRKSKRCTLVCSRKNKQYTLVYSRKNKHTHDVSVSMRVVIFTWPVSYTRRKPCTRICTHQMTHDSTQKSLYRISHVLYDIPKITIIHTFTTTTISRSNTCRNIHSHICTLPSI